MKDNHCNVLLIHNFIEEYYKLRKVYSNFSNYRNRGLTCKFNFYEVKNLLDIIDKYNLLIKSFIHSLKKLPKDNFTDSISNRHKITKDININKYNSSFTYKKIYLENPLSQSCLHIINKNIFKKNHKILFNSLSYDKYKQKLSYDSYLNTNLTNSYCNLKTNLLTKKDSIKTILKGNKSITYLSNCKKICNENKYECIPDRLNYKLNRINDYHNNRIFNNFNNNSFNFKMKINSIKDINKNSNIYNLKNYIYNINNDKSYNLCSLKSSINVYKKINKYKYLGRCFYNEKKKYLYQNSNILNISNFKKKKVYFSKPEKTDNSNVISISRKNNISAQFNIKQASYNKIIKKNNNFTSCKTIVFGIKAIRNKLISDNHSLVNLNKNNRQNYSYSNYSFKYIKVKNKFCKNVNLVQVYKIKNQSI